MKKAFSPTITQYLQFKTKLNTYNIDIHIKFTVIKFAVINLRIIYPQQSTQLTTHKIFTYRSSWTSLESLLVESDTKPFQFIFKDGMFLQ